MTTEPAPHGRRVAVAQPDEPSVPVTRSNELAAGRPRLGCAGSLGGTFGPRLW